MRERRAWPEQNACFSAIFLFHFIKARRRLGSLNVPSRLAQAERLCQRRSKSFRDPYVRSENHRTDPPQSCRRWRASSSCSLFARSLRDRASWLCVFLTGLTAALALALAQSSLTGRIPKLQEFLTDAAAIALHRGGARSLDPRLGDSSALERTAAALDARRQHCRFDLYRERARHADARGPSSRLA